MPSQDDHSLAESVTNGLISRFTESGMRPEPSPKLEVFFADVESAAQRFSIQLGALVKFGLPFQCISLPASRGGTNLLPIDFGLPASRDLFRTAFGAVANIYRDLAKRFPFAIKPVSIVETSPQDTLGIFSARLSEFLAVRFGARNSDISASPGLLFTVKTETHGLRVHYSDACFFNPNNVLNSPTTPVSGWIQPGRYLFGASRAGQPPKFDFTAEYDIPPHTYAELYL